MNDEARPQRRNRSRRRNEGGQRRQAPRPAYARRRNDFATGGYSSIYAGPFPTDDDEQGMNLADLQAKPIDELRGWLGTDWYNCSACRSTLTRDTALSKRCAA